MKTQLHIFFAALMFLTRLPIPKWVQHDERYLQKSTTYFPLVGLLIGILLSGFYYLLEKVFPTSIALLLTMAASLLLTGAFHEDGFADMCDAFGGGYIKEKILEIMKDSRLGTYGTAGLIMMLLLKFVLWQNLAETIFFDTYTIIQIPEYAQFLVILVTAQSISRFMPLLVIQFFDYVYQQDVSKSKPLASQNLTVGEIIFALLTSLIGFVFLPIKLMIALLPMLFVTILLGKYFTKKIQGYTGDCLGATQQIAEITFYLFIIILNKVTL